MGDVEREAAILVRLVLALVLAGLIGWEREASDKPAGLRTHMLVGLGAALFVALGHLVIADFRPYGADSLRYDPMRLLEAITAGVAFLGAGTILVRRGGERVSGLTTAASLWVTAAIGAAVGLEHYLLAAGATGLVVGVLRVLAHLESARAASRHRAADQPD